MDNTAWTDFYRLSKVTILNNQPFVFFALLRLNGLKMYKNNK